MRLLVLGGSWFVGHELVTQALGRGIEVTVFNRGVTATPPPGVRVVRGDWESPASLVRLAKLGPWDVAVDVAGAVPAVVTNVVRALRPRVGRYAFMSTISAYRDWPYTPVDETSPLYEGDPDSDPGTRRWDPDTYGPLKVGCELAVRREYGDEALILRPHVIIGPREYVGRVPYWLTRIERDGRVLAPAPAGRSIQPIDVRDVVAFGLDRVEASDHGVFNLAAPQGRDTYGDLLESCRAATGSSAELVWADEEWLKSRGVAEWTELPLWRTLPTAWAMNTDKAQATGLRCRPLRETVTDTWAWLQSGGRPVAHERFAEHGLALAKEAALLAEWERSGA